MLCTDKATVFWLKKNVGNKTITINLVSGPLILDIPAVETKVTKQENLILIDKKMKRYTMKISHLHQFLIVCRQE